MTPQSCGTRKSQAHSRRVAGRLLGGGGEEATGETLVKGRKLVTVRCVSPWHVIAGWRQS